MATTTDELKRLHEQEAEASRSDEQGSVQLKGFDYIELYVGNASQAAYFYRAAFGFTPIAHRGLETGVRDRTSILVEQNDIRLVLTAALGPDHPIAEHVKLHGDDVKDIAFTTDDAAHAFEVTVKRGAQPIMEPTVIEGPGGSIVKATIGAFGDTVHSFIQRDTAPGVFFPDFQALANPVPAVPTGLTAIDHVAVSVEPEKLNDLVDYYNDVLHFHHTFTEDIETAYSSMSSKVVENSTGKIKFPIVEPAASKRRSQIEEYLTFHHGPGAQHIALASENIIETVRALRAGGNEFLHTPDTYYSALEDRVGEIEEDVEALRELGILVDRDEWGYLMQIFTKPLQNRPTGFMEIIQRKRARGFGSGNIKALFQAIEREQSMRGNL
jgi:4-hydroxyphenylpyruvate dioxygenase